MDTRHDLMQDRLEHIPLIDAHDHVMQSRMMSNLRHHLEYTAGPGSDGERPSILACLILDLSNYVALRSSGMPGELIEGILDGSVAPHEARKAVLGAVGRIENTTTWRTFARGVEELYGVDPAELDAERKLLSDYIMYLILELAQQHGGYPYLREMSILGANSPNVYLNLSWLPTLSYDVSVSWLAEVLARKVDRGLLTEEAAVRIAARLMHENVSEIYRISGDAGGTHGPEPQT